MELLLTLHRMLVSQDCPRRRKRHASAAGSGCNKELPSRGFNLSESALVGKWAAEPC